MLIARKVALKVIVTDDFKKRYVAQLNSLSAEVKVELEKIKTTEAQLMLKVQTMDYNYVMQVREQLEREKSTRESTLKEIESRTAEMQGMAEGTIFPQGTLDSLVEIKSGDDLELKLSKAEIIIKDNVVQSVNEG
ncbi:MAG TPA: YlqD family protein [Caldisericia bacterium]|nr:YlqD family protein [Caldisericia bacterium]HOU08533.1 YlqD family protein [Caldisericia bacterium]HPL88774.1 YlqD family protein [Caldisericia bacterium]HQG59874.1 YlqD family protein [Caldisericia bacterium]HQH49440.1 YlqD family protein [Caldisericia bacterium]